MCTATLVKKRRPRLMRAERIPSVFEERLRIQVGCFGRFWMLVFKRLGSGSFNVRPFQSENPDSSQNELYQGGTRTVFNSDYDTVFSTVRKGFSRKLDPDSGFLGGRIQIMVVLSTLIRIRLIFMRIRNPGSRRTRAARAASSTPVRSSLPRYSSWIRTSYTCP